MTERVIYFIKPTGMDGPVKIGISARPKGRMLEMLEWSPFDLEIAHTIPGSYQLERMIQEALADDHIRHEWFRPTKRVVKLLADLCAGVPLDKAIDLTRREGPIRTRISAGPRVRVNALFKVPITGPSGLTPGQRECFTFVKFFIEENGRSPSMQEISDGIGLNSKSGAHRHVMALVERGHLGHTPGRQHCLVLIEDEQMARAAA